MAKPIEASEILTGKDAERFVYEMEHPKCTPQKRELGELAKKTFKEHPF